MRRFLARALAVLVLLWLCSLGAVVYASRHDAAGPAEAIVVMGAAQYNGRPSPVLKARLDQAAELFRRHLAPRIIVTGGIGSGDSVSEAEVSRRYLADSHIPRGVVIVEKTGRTSEESLRGVSLLLGPTRATVILVSDGFHMLRLAILARRFGLKPLGSPARLSPIRRSRKTEALYMLAESFKAPLAFFVTRSE